MEQIVAFIEDRCHLCRARCLALARERIVLGMSLSPSSATVARLLSFTNMAAVEDELVAGTSKVSVAEKIQQGLVLKAEGNEYFKKQEYRNAMKCYHKALLHVKGLVDRPTLGLDSLEQDISDDDKHGICQVQFSCYNNLAGKTKEFFAWNLLVELP